ncbi:MAG: C69 family dipeptidase [Bacteroidales bacterium]
MKKNLLSSSSLLWIFLLNFSVLTQAQYITADEESQNPHGNCTSIMVGRLATTDGSVITSHTCDGPYRTWLEIFPHTKYEKGTLHSVYSGTLDPRETSWDMRNVTKTGEVPEAEETYAFLNTAYPCLNEKQLAIGETTIEGRPELRNAAGIFYIEELEKIALQRCTTAREAIALIGKLAEEYGYGDYAECITIADPKEVWQLEIAGSGKGKPSAIWCAARIPDDHVGVSANMPRISTIEFNNPDLFMYSTDLQKTAKNLGYWDGKEPLKFWKIISSFGKPFGTREFYILSTLAPSLKLSMDTTELPFSVKPEKKLSPRDVMKYFRETYEDTQFDMTKDLLITIKSKDDKGNDVEGKIKSPAVNNWMNSELKRLLNELKPGVVKNKYTIAQNFCSYSHIIQCRSWLPDEVGAVAWFSFDNPALSPRIPIFSGVLKLPESFSICGQQRYRTDAAIWSFRETNRLATINWSWGRKLIEPAVTEFEDKAFEEMPAVEKKVTELVKSGKNDDAKQYVTDYTNNFAYAAMKKWEEMKAPLWSMYSMGF